MEGGVREDSQSQKRSFVHGHTASRDGFLSFNVCSRSHVLSVVTVEKSR